MSQVPTLSLSSTYPNPPTERYDAISQTCQALYHLKPSFFARAPGRVNIIGEHIDHQGFGVLPMALERDVVIGVAILSDEDSITISNVNTEEYPSKCVPCVENEMVVDPANHHWTNYVVAGFKGILQARKCLKTKAMGLVVDGNCPIGSGLSSSSAMVCASSIAISQANDLPMDKAEMASTCALAEQFVGIAGGGMDQATSFLGVPSGALHITFDPLAAVIVDLPPDAAFVVAHSLVYSHKAQSSGYNCRVAECRLAAMLVLHANSMEWRGVKKLRQVAEVIDDFREQHKHIPDAPVTIKGVAEILGVSESEVREQLPQRLSDEKFDPKSRYIHVIEENDRVNQFADLCKSGQASIVQLGQIMNEGHASMGDLFDASTPEVDELTRLCCKLGAVGSRITGAGWGGATVSLVPTSIVDQFVNSLKQSDFYKGHRDACVFASKPSIGAAVVR